MKKNQEESTSQSDTGGAERIATAMQSLIDKHGGETKALELLLTENYELRAKNRALREQNGDLNGKLPAEGALVLTGDEAKTWATYQALGKPEDLAAGIEERDKLKTETARFARQAEIVKVAEANKFNAKVLETLAGDLQFEVKEVEHEGKKLTQTFILVPGEDGKRVSSVAIADYVESHWKEFLPALQANGQQQAASPDDSTGTPYIQQKRGATPKDSETDLVGQRLKLKDEASKAKPNPLMATVPGYQSGSGSMSESKN